LIVCSLIEHTFLELDSGFTDIRLNKFPKLRYQTAHELREEIK